MTRSEALHYARWRWHVLMARAYRAAGARSAWRGHRHKAAVLAEHWRGPTEAIEWLLPPGPESSGDELNTRICMLISTSRYREALAAADDHRGLPIGPRMQLYIDLNLVEARYNLGQLDQALDDLLALKEACALSSVFWWYWALAFGWLCALRGEPERASQPLGRIEAERFSLAYRAELEMTLAAYYRAKGDLAQALVHAQRARDHVVRWTSRRNVEFLEANLRADRGEIELALAHFERGINDPYQGQGGPDLVRYAELLLERDRDDEAAAVCELAIERDPQSPACAQARELLRQLRKGSGAGAP